MQVTLFTAARVPPLRRGPRRRAGGARSARAFELEEIDIESSDALIEEYGVRIPVVAIDGVEALRVHGRRRRASPSLVRTA